MDSGSGCCFSVFDFFAVVGFGSTDGDDDDRCFGYDDDGDRIDILDGGIPTR